MKLKSLFIVIGIGFFSYGFSQSDKTKILIVGSDHLAQVYNEKYPGTDVLTDKNQKYIKEFTALIEKYSPDMIGIEELPEKQQEIDSLYTLYKRGELDLKGLQYGRSEKYQIAFRIGKNVGLEAITCVNAEGGTSQSILDNGKNIELYKNETQELRKMVGEKYSALQQGAISFKEFLTFLNQPQNYNLIYHLRYITPARVVDGTFDNPDEMVDTAFINPKYIGAELIAVFKNRDYKIYSNIVTNQLVKKSNRILIVIGVAHIGSLKNIFRDDPDYEIIEANEYILKE